MTTPAGSPARSANWNLPNAITVVRILLAPMFFWMLLADGGDDGWLRWAAAALFIIAIATDGIDGHIARSRGLVTDLGKILDPIADKLLTSGALVCLSILGELPWWVTAIIVVREVGITVLAVRGARPRQRRARVVAAASSRRWCSRSRSRSRSCRCGPIFGDWIHWVNVVLMTAAVVLTVWSGLLYVRDAVRLARARRDRWLSRAMPRASLPGADVAGARSIAHAHRRGA